MQGLLAPISVHLLKVKLWPKILIDIDIGDVQRTPGVSISLCHG